MKGVRQFQEGIDKIATQKYDYDKLLLHYNNTINEIDNPKNDNENNENKKEDDKNIDIKEKKKMEKAEKALMKKKKKEMKAKRAMLVKERNKIMEKYAPVKKEFDIKTDLLYKKCDTIDKYKIELDRWDNEKNKIRNDMQQYIFDVEEKNKEYIQVLSDKLKLSENYKKSYKF